MKNTHRLLGLVGMVALGLATTARGTSTSNASNFNGTDIADTSFIWFSAHLTSVTGASGPVTIYFKNQFINFTSPATSAVYHLAVPDSQLTIDSSFSSASTVFSGGAWVTDVPSASNDPFIGGFTFDVPAGENPKSTNPVTWTGDFSASQAGISVNWQWAAAVYTSFPNDYNALGVAPIDGTVQSGTPVNYEGFVTGGARGGGGSNYTGSNSGTVTVSNLTAVPEPTTTALLILASLLVVGRAFIGRRTRAAN